MATKRICSIPDCGNPHEAKGMCLTHYLRHRKYGSTEPRDPMNKGERWLRDHANYDSDECLKWPFGGIRKNKLNYGSAYLNKASMPASRAMCIVAHGEPPADRLYHAAHSCGNGHLGCVNPRHLRWATPKENAEDTKAHGRHLEGTKAYGVKLNEANVREIRSLEDQFTHSALGRKFGVSRKCISKVLARATWGWLPD